jgi:hypothetical protein
MATITVSGPAAARSSPRIWVKLFSKACRLAWTSAMQAGVGPAVQDGTTLNTSLPPMSMVTTLTSLLRRWSVLRVRNLSTAAGNWESISDAVVAPPTARFSSASLRQPSDRNLAGQLLAQQVIQQGHVGGRSAPRAKPSAA